MVKRVSHGRIGIPNSGLGTPRISIIHRFTAGLAAKTWITGIAQQFGLDVDLGSW